MAKAAGKTEAAAPTYPVTKQAVAALVLGWLIPGAGHLLLKRWGRGALLMGSIGSMFVLGILMQGKVYEFNLGDILDILGFVGDVGAGGMYLAARMFNLGHGAINLATADYGTKFIIVSGLLNVVAAIDAYDIGGGTKQ